MPKLPKVVTLLFLQCLKKEVSDEVDILYVYNLESFLQNDAMIFDWGGQAFLKFSK